MGKRELVQKTACVTLLLGIALICGCEELVVRDAESLLIPRFQRSEIVGFVAGVGTTFAAFPDLLRMMKTRSSRGINPSMAGIMGLFQLVWIYYGLLIVSRPVVVWNLIGVVINFVTVRAYFRFARNDRNAEGVQSGGDASCSSGNGQGR